MTEQVLEMERMPRSCLQRPGRLMSAALRLPGQRNRAMIVC